MDIVTLVIPLAIGLVVAWIFHIKRISDAVKVARSESRVELVILNEQLTSAKEEGKQLRIDLTESKKHEEELQYQLESARNEGAKLTERASRVPMLESELRTAATNIQDLNQKISDLYQKMGASDSTISGQLQEISRLNNESQNLIARRDQLLTDIQTLTKQFTEISTTLDAERSLNEEKLALLNDARSQLTNQFKVLANEILEEKSKRFTEQNQTNIGQLLEPLKVKLTEFQGKVEEVYIQEGKERSALAEQVKHLMALNTQLSDDAHNLTRALKGSTKTQGNWGEMILEKILDSSGLRKGQEYDVQESHTRDNGSRVQPDVVIHLPEERHIVVDAKVSLTAYEQYINADSDSEREIAVKRHLESVRSHIKSLADKNYQDIHGVKSLDFVLMFIPIEPAFMLAISQDIELWQEAWKKNILLVSPSTLLFVVRTVAHLWRQEQQNRNAQDIAKRGADLYDKLVGFVEDLKLVGNRLNQAQKSYDDAYGKLAKGKGNVIRQAEMLRELGIKPGKQIPNEMVETSEDDTQ